MEVYTNLDNQGYYKKPDKMVEKVSRRVSEMWNRMEISELAELVGNNGYAVIPGHMLGGTKEENCKGMQLFMLDFNHGVTFQEIKSRCDTLGIPISFAYRTYGSSLLEERFRVAFVHNNLIEDSYVVKIVLLMLHKIFPECNQSYKNLNRIFFGGKELIYLDTRAHFTLVQLICPFFEALDVGDNFKRNIRSFCSKYHILLFNDRPAMGEISLLSTITKFDGNMDSAIIHKIGESMNPSFFIIESVGAYQRIKSKHKQKKLEIKEAYGCKLLNDFNLGIEIDYMGRFAIVTNLMYINGGAKHFFRIMDTYYREESLEKWKKIIYYMTGYCPQRCSDSFCPYYEKCENAGTIVDTLALDRKVYREEEEYHTLDQAWQCLVDNLDNAFCSIGSGIHLIKAQTGLGKTSAYINLIRNNPYSKFLIALPTTNLKKKVYERLLVAGISREEIFVTKNVMGNNFFPIEMQETISEAHQHGIHNATGRMVAEYYSEIKEDVNKIAIAEVCQQILQGIKAVKDERIIVTSHAYLFNMPEDFLKEYTIIIDEDILQLQILNRMSSISVSCLQELSQTGYKPYSAIASQMLDAKENYYQKIQENLYAKPLTEEQLGELEYYGNDNVNDMALAGAYVKMKDSQSGNQIVKYFCPQRLHPMKYIILSATVNLNIYQQYFSQKMKVYLYPEKNASYQGELIQFTYHSLGRRDLTNKMQVFALARKVAEDEALEIITFKESSKLRGVKNMNTVGLHFGNSTGVNDMEGKAIGIVGTPYKVPEAYKLIACYLGADVNQEIDEQPKIRRIKYKNSSFLITTYNDTILREVQLYSIESELEQCIGRARLLRHDCMVYLFSCFPCEQAKLQIKNYL